jgi:hypothetical protein
LEYPQFYWAKQTNDYMTRSIDSKEDCMYEEGHHGRNQKRRNKIHYDGGQANYFLRLPKTHHPTLHMDLETMMGHGKVIILKETKSTCEK